LWIDDKLAVPELLPVDRSGRHQSARVRALLFCSARWGGFGTVAGVADPHAIEPDPTTVDVEVVPGKHSFVWKRLFPSGSELATEPLELELSCPPGSSVEDAEDEAETSSQGCALGAAAHGRSERASLALASLLGLCWRLRRRRA
jgi:hypothetical protein